MNTRLAGICQACALALCERSPERTLATHEPRYFVFSGIRNPLDDIVSMYFKYKTNHLQAWTDATKLQKARAFRRKEKYQFIQATDADFPTYFKKFHKLPYNTLGLLAYPASDYVIRFEHLQHDFAEVLRRIGLEPKRPLPVVNQTSERQPDFAAYYTPEIIPQAKRVVGPAMQQWGYPFPPAWGEVRVAWWWQLAYQVCNLLRHLYWRYVWSSR